jgi:hypothetical protein
VCAGIADPVAGPLRAKVGFKWRERAKCGEREEGRSLLVFVVLVLGRKSSARYDVRVKERTGFRVDLFGWM